MLIITNVFPMVIRTGSSTTMTGKKISNTNATSGLDAIFQKVLNVVPW
jgi:hypothetical protein